MISEQNISPSELTADEFKERFKEQFICSIKDTSISPEILRKLLVALNDAQEEALESYREGRDIGAISSASFEWEQPGYFHKQVYFAEQNFCLERMEHLIRVKSHLIEHGIAGFAPSSADSCIVTHSFSQHTGNDFMGSEFTGINLSGYKPPQSLVSVVASDDLSNIRNALFMEMNDTSLTTHQMRQAFGWVLEKKPNLFVPHEENAYAQAINSNLADWDTDYYGMQEVYAASNFSEKRLTHMLVVREQVFDIPNQPDRKSVV